MRKYVFALVLSLFATAFPLSAQCLVSSDGNKPSWISSSRPRPRNTPNSDYIVISVKGQTLNEARANAEQEVYVARMNAVGRRIVEDGPDDIRVRYRCVGEHYESRRDSYHLWQLVQIAKRPDSELEPIPQSELSKLEKNTVGLKPFVPGMAQIHRGYNTSGVLFITGVSTLSVGIVATEVLRADNNAKVGTTFNTAQRQQYINNAETFQNARNILIAAAGAVYLWNVIDGYVGGKSGQSQVSDSDFRIAPYADLRSCGFMLSFNLGNGGR